jgi:ribosome maturation factor RimP
MSKNRLDEIIKALEPKATAHGFELVSAEIVGSGNNTVLRVYLDKPELNLDDLAAANVWLGEAVDNIDPFKGSYMLEVSSPGIDRPLRTEQHFVRFVGEEARVSTRPIEVAGKARSRWTGILRGFLDNNILLECDGITHRIPFTSIRKAHLLGKVDFSKPKLPRDGDERRDD